MIDIRKWKVNMQEIPLALLLIVSCARWLIDGVMDFMPLVVLAFALGVYFVINKRLTFRKTSLIWALFAINILFSLLTHKSSVSIWGQGFITMLSVGYVLVYDDELLGYRKSMRLLMYLGLGAAAMVLVHLVLGKAFNSLYFPLLTDKAAGHAQLYFNDGYYFGFIYHPHETAGLITFAIAGVLFWMMLRREKKPLPYVVVALLLASLFLTKKTGIIICLVLVLGVMFLYFYIRRNGWIKLKKPLIALGIFAAVNVVLLFVFPKFGPYKIVHQLLSGKPLDSSRAALYRAAWQEFLAHPLFGIGWRGFNAVTTSKYGFGYAHEVNFDYLQWLCETGLVGFALSIAPVIITLYRTGFIIVKMFPRVRKQAEKWILLVCTFIQLFTVIYAFFEIPFFDIVFFSVYILSCIIINSAYTRRGRYL